MNRQFCASAFVIDPINKKILLCHHQKFDCWVQPGGHIEENELPEETALRETYEETGVRIKLVGQRFPREDDFIKPLGIQKNRGKDGSLHVDIIYAAIPLLQDVIPNDDEIDQCAWFNIEELENIKVFPDIKITYNYIIKNIIK
ncbi:MAG: NUDIX domain-containing protein [Bacilli bacterium]